MGRNPGEAGVPGEEVVEDGAGAPDVVPPLGGTDAGAADAGLEELPEPAAAEEPVVAAGDDGTDRPELIPVYEVVESVADPGPGNGVEPVDDAAVGPMPD